MTTDQVRALIKSDLDFIYSKRFNYSLDALKKRHPDEAPVKVIAAVLMVTEDDVHTEWAKVVAKLKGMLNPDSL